ncbi:hypothetical protein PoB_003199600 [Plakobranchus ocellatus]|uniref:Uncharacterized protein n=1 Tax=Plakobranchus ocellatus TaxID=259542 RepID=A0AAV4AFT4_9GAST|nr:hypothetical protein PoB_003199600 [Plakobranchus ocellatus]
MQRPSYSLCCNQARTADHSSSQDRGSASRMQRPSHYFLSRSLLDLSALGLTVHLKDAASTIKHSVALGRTVHLEDAAAFTLLFAAITSQFICRKLDSIFGKCSVHHGTLCCDHDTSSLPGSSPGMAHHFQVSHR